MRPAAPFVRSFTGIVIAAEGELLLGGVKRHESARFAREDQARDWVDVIMDTNAEAGRKVASAAVVGTGAPPEVE